MSERPRDRLGRPLPAGSDNLAPPLPDIVGLDDSAVWALVAQCIDDGLPFTAHEISEERWRTCPPEYRTAWRALAQWGAALTHRARGNVVGAQRLALRTLLTLDGAAAVPSAVDLDRVRASCALLASD